MQALLCRLSRSIERATHCGIGSTEALESDVCRLAAHQQISIRVLDHSLQKQVLTTPGVCLSMGQSITPVSL